MAQLSYVPEFGDWDNDNTPYTPYFENARKERAAGVKMKTDGPKDNPEASMRRRESLQVKADHREVQGPPFVNSSKSTSSVQKHHIEGHRGHHACSRKTSDQQKNGSQDRSITSESGSHGGNSDYSVIMQPTQGRVRSDKKKISSDEGINSFSSSVAGLVEKSIGGYTSVGSTNKQHHRAPEIPKFGAWDETDPRSGEGYTVIFNQQIAEKQIASSQCPKAPQQPAGYHSNSQRHGGYSYRSKICCCLFSRGSK